MNSTSDDELVTRLRHYAALKTWGGCGKAVRQTLLDALAEIEMLRANSDGKRQMRLAREIMKADRNMLRELAKASHPRLKD